MSPCPHCGTPARAERSAFFRFRCAVCGGPVVARDDGAMVDTLHLASLVRAQRLRGVAVGWLAGAVACACITAFAGGLTLLLWVTTHTAMLATFILGAIALVAASAAVAFRLRGARASAEARRELDTAWGPADADRRDLGPRVLPISP